MTTYWDGNTSQEVFCEDNVATVINRNGYHHPDSLAVELTNTGNGYIAKFPAHNCTTQDYYVCLDYAQAYDLILALSAFKEELGFK
jgi:hypothetical protein